MVQLERALQLAVQRGLAPEVEGLVVYQINKVAALLRRRPRGQLLLCVGFPASRRA
jgi:hypothetical protein